MCIADPCKNAHIRADHFFQYVHFIPVRNTCLDQGKVVFTVHIPEGQRNPDLTVEAARGPDDLEMVLANGIKPFLYPGFAIAPGQGDDGHAELFPVVSSDQLEGLRHIWYNQEAGFHVCRDQFFIPHDKCPAAEGVGVSDVGMSVFPAAFQGEKQGLCREDHGPAVYGQVPDGPVRRINAGPGYGKQVMDLSDRIHSECRQGLLANHGKSRSTCQNGSCTGSAKGQNRYRCDNIFLQSR